MYLVADHSEKRKYSNKPHVLEKMVGRIFFDREDIIVKGIKMKLSVGDYMWLARKKEGEEWIVLPLIVERKTYADFARSVADKRYYEQKTRMMKCGINRRIIIYENDVKKRLGKSSSKKKLRKRLRWIKNMF
eukprot:UN32162